MGQETPIPDSKRMVSVVLLAPPLIFRYPYLHKWTQERKAEEMRFKFTGEGGGTRQRRERLLQPSCFSAPSFLPLFLSSFAVKINHEFNFLGTELGSDGRAVQVLGAGEMNGSVVKSICCCYCRGQGGNETLSQRLEKSREVWLKSQLRS